MNTKATEGPYTLGTNGDDCAPNHAICVGPCVIAKVYGTGYPSGKGSSPESTATARLLAASWEMHEWLERVTTAWFAGGPTQAMYDDARTLLTRIDGS